jgi:ATP-binding cassette subfamily B multidrug efflux pump
MTQTVPSEKIRERRNRRSTRTRITDIGPTGAGVVWRITLITLQFKWHFAGAALAAVFSAIIFLIIPRLLGEGVDQAFTLIQEGDFTRGEIEDLLWRTAIFVVIFGFSRGIFGFIQMFLGDTLSQRVSNRLRMIYFDQLQAQSFSFYDSVHTGQLMSRGLSDIEGVRMFVQTGLVQTFRVAVMVIAAAVFMVMIDWQLALISLGFVPFLIFRSARLRLQLRKTWRQIQDALGDLTTTMQENLAGVRVVRAFSAQKFEEDKFDVTAREVVGLRLEAARQHAKGGGSISFAFLIAWAALLWLGGMKVIDGHMTVGELTQFFAFLALLRFPVRMMMMIVNSTARATSAGGRIFEVLDLPSKIADDANAQPLEVTDGVVRFDNVTFGFQGAPALKDVSFEATPTHSIGIVGPPGSGKSSIANLVPRFYDPDSGEVTIDGTPVDSVTVESARRAVGLVEQDPFLFDGSIKDNIRYGDPYADDESVIEAAKVAQIHDFISNLPESYETIIGERGVGLSGGQRQRVAIARTLLRNPKILIFDDSTSSVDAGTDARIRVALDQMPGDHTVITIAHRLSSLQRSDEILVLERGSVVERGSHDELLASDTQYKALWELQQKESLGLSE